MTCETLLYIDETLNPAQQAELLRWLGNRPEGMHARHRSRQPHLMFVAYEPLEMCPHDLVAIVNEHELHAQLIDL